ncbi:hypothetical protein BHE74_00055860, partial [Ensete ventricosum]
HHLHAGRPPTREARPVCKGGGLLHARHASLAHKVLVAEVAAYVQGGTAMATAPKRGGVACGRGDVVREGDVVSRCADCGKAAAARARVT